MPIRTPFRAFDASAVVSLRSLVDGPETDAAALNTGVVSRQIEIPRLNTAHWHDGALLTDHIGVSIHVTHIDLDDGGPAVFDLEAVAPHVTLGSVRIGAPGRYQIYVDQGTLQNLMVGAAVNATHVRLRVTMRGTAPTITYAASASGLS